MNMVQQFYRPSEALVRKPLHYTDCGLDNVYLMNGFEEEGEYLTIKDLDGLHRAIGLHIVLGRKAPSGKEIRFIRDELDMSQSDLAGVLGVSDQSVARWEKGTCEVPGPAVFALRIIYILSLVPAEERVEIMDGILQRLESLMQLDETSDAAFFSYSENKWHDKIAA